MKAFDDGRNDPAFQRHYARVILAQARVFRMRTTTTPGWLHSLLNWAGDARRRAQSLAQRDLFGIVP